MDCGYFIKGTMVPVLGDFLILIFHFAEGRRECKGAWNNVINSRCWKLGLEFVAFIQNRDIYQHVKFVPIAVPPYCIEQLVCLFHMMSGYHVGRL